MLTKHHLFNEFLYTKNLISSKQLIESRIARITKETEKECKYGIFCNTENVESLVNKYVEKRILHNSVKIYSDSNFEELDKIFCLEFAKPDASDVDELFHKTQNQNLIIQDQYAHYGKKLPIHQYRGIKYHISPESQIPSHFGNNQYLFEVKKLIKDFNKPITILDMCAGQGSVGFTIINESENIGGLISVEIYSQQIEDMKKTISDNKLPANKIQLIESNALDNVQSDIKVDLVVCNPPHSNKTPKNWDQLGGADQDWKFHKNFLSKISSHLNSDGLVTLLERKGSSNTDLFSKMLPNDLKIINSQILRYTDWYIITIAHK